MYLGQFYWLGHYGIVTMYAPGDQKLCKIRLYLLEKFGISYQSNAEMHVPLNALFWELNQFCGVAWFLVVSEGNQNMKKFWELFCFLSLQKWDSQSTTRQIVVFLACCVIIFSSDSTMDFPWVTKKYYKICKVSCT